MPSQKSPMCGFDSTHISVTLLSPFLIPIAAVALLPTALPAVAETVSPAAGKSSQQMTVVNSLETSKSRPHTATRSYPQRAVEDVKVVLDLSRR